MVTVFIGVEDIEEDVNREKADEIQNAIISLLTEKGVRHSVTMSWQSKNDSIEHKKAIGRWIDDIFDGGEVGWK